MGQETMGGLAASTKSFNIKAKNKEIKREDMTAHRYGGGEGLL